LLVGFVGDHVARVIGASGADAIDPDQPLHEIGLDSLMAVDLRNRLGASLGLGRSLPATLVFDYPTLEALSTYLERELFAGDGSPTPPDVPAAVDPVGTIENLSDLAIEQLFASKMRET
jgi:acyl carrier protein